MDNESEIKFKEWLDTHKVPYWYIDQSLGSFSPELKRLLMKRPDFMILLPNFGFIFVDVKNKCQAEKYPKFFIETTEVDKYLGMQTTLNTPIWFVISHKSYHYKTWFWIPVSNVGRAGFIFNGSDGVEYYSVPIEEFVQVADTDSLERIFSKLFKK